MGFFSSLCEGCGHPLLSPQATDSVNAWMSQGVAIGVGGTIHAGTYDGYGGLGADGCPTGGNMIDGATVWHRACWEAAGKPTEHAGESAHAPDQGWFFEPGAHDIEPPRSP